MKYIEQLVSDRPLGDAAIETVDHLQNEILQTSNETPYEALFEAYEMLTDAQKIAFILTGGAERMFQRQRQRIRQRKTGRCSSDTETGQLPILC
jgi:DNA-binding MurR/RpiR family transcriptional regulator